MRVLLHHPKREVAFKGPCSVGKLLKGLELLPETVLVIRNDTLATEDEMLQDGETIEIRPVISGGSPLASTPRKNRPSEIGEQEGEASLYRRGAWGMGALEVLHRTAQAPILDDASPYSQEKMNGSL